MRSLNVILKEVFFQESWENEEWVDRNWMHIGSGKIYNVAELADPHNLMKGRAQHHDLVKARPDLFGLSHVDVEGKSPDELSDLPLDRGFARLTFGGGVHARTVPEVQEAVKQYYKHSRDHNMVAEVWPKEIRTENKWSGHRWIEIDSLDKMRKFISDPNPKFDGDSH